MIIGYDLSHLLGYLGIFITIMFGIWGIYAAIKNRQFLEISFVIRKSIALFDTIVKNISELSVLYEGSPITQNLILIEGAFINTGTRDILPTMIEKPICLDLPKDYKWVTAKIINTSNNVEASATLSESTITINSGLFKLNEYIRFQALLLAPNDENIANIETQIDRIIKITHRIADMPNIKNRKISNIKLYQVIVGFMALLLPLIALGYIGYDIGTLEGITDDVYLYKKSPNENIKVIIKEVTEHNFIIEGIDVPYKEKVNAKEFITKREKIGTKLRKSFFPLVGKVLFSLAILLLIFPLTIYIFELRKYRKDKKLYNIFL